MDNRNDGQHHQGSASASASGASQTRPLYRILNIEADATEEQIKRAYREMALRYHPDKAGPESTEHFKQIQAAYQVLSDPAKREVYDKYGEQGLSNMDMPGMAEMGRMMGMINVIIAVFILAFFAFTLFIIFLAFLSVKVENRVDWRWTSVFVPIYIADVVVSFIALGLIVMKISNIRTRYRDTHPDDIQSSLGRDIAEFLIYIWFLCFVAFNIAVSVGLQKIEDGTGDEVNWWRYFIPAFVSESCALVAGIIGITKIRDMLRMQGVAFIRPAIVYRIAFCNAVCFLCRLAQMILIAAKVSGSTHASWWAIGIPIYIHHFVHHVNSINMATAQREAMEKLDEATPDEADRPPRGSVLGVCIPSFFVHGLHLSFLIMVIAKLEGAGIPLEQCFIPLLIIVGGLTCFSCCGMCGSCIFAKTMTDEFRDMEEAQQERAQQEGTSAADQQGAGQNQDMPLNNKNSHAHNNNNTNHNQHQNDDTFDNVAPRREEEHPAAIPTTPPQPPRQNHSTADID